MLGLKRVWDGCDGGNKARGKSEAEPGDVGVDVDIQVEVEAEVDVEVAVGVDVEDIGVNGGEEFSHETANPWGLSSPSPSPSSPHCCCWKEKEEASEMGGFVVVLIAIEGG